MNIRNVFETERYCIRDLNHMEIHKIIDTNPQTKIVI